MKKIIMTVCCIAVILSVCSGCSPEKEQETASETESKKVEFLIGDDDTEKESANDILTPEQEEAYKREMESFLEELGQNVDEEE